MSLDRYPAVSTCAAFSSMTERRFFYVHTLPAHPVSFFPPRPHRTVDGSHDHGA